MGDRFDRTTFQVQPVEDLKVYQQRVNEVMARLSSELNRLSGTGGPATTQDSANIHTDNYTFINFDNLFGVKGALCSNNDPTNKRFYLSYGAQKASDGQWVAKNKTAVILGFSDAGALELYSNTGLTPEAAFTPTSTGIGSTLLASQITAVGNSAVGSYSTVASCTIPANYIDGTTVKGVRVFASGDFAANGDTKDIRLVLGSTTLSSSGSGTHQNQWWFDATISRLDATNQRGYVINYRDASAVAGARVTSAENLATDLVLKMEGYSNGLTNDVICEAFFVYVIR